METRKYLLASLGRLRDEFLKYKSQPKDENRFQLFQDCGLSLDTNLWPDFLLEAAFRTMLERGMLKPGGVSRIAVVGPGLDFANKEAGNDFYPPQTIQPFAVLDSLIRLGIANPATVELDTLDISEDVNVMSRGFERRSPRAVVYSPIAVEWRASDERVVSRAIHRVLAATGRQNRAKRCADRGPQAGREHPYPRGESEGRHCEAGHGVHVNVVYKRLNWPAARAYDLVIGTNIFVYYGVFE